MTIGEPAPGVVLVVIEGADVGDLGDAPFRALDAVLERGPVSLFIDARRSRGVSVDVSNDWARWLADNRRRLVHTTMLTGTRLVAITASFVARFAELGEAMRVLDDPEPFDRALAEAIARPR